MAYRRVSLGLQSFALWLIQHAQTLPFLAKKQNRCVQVVQAYVIVVTLFLTSSGEAVYIAKN